MGKKKYENRNGNRIAILPIMIEYILIQFDHSAETQIVYVYTHPIQSVSMMSIANTIKSQTSHSL